MLRTRLTEKSDQLTTAKMKIDELRVFKNDNINSATSQLQEKLQKIITENKQCSQVMEEQNCEVCILTNLFFIIIFFISNEMIILDKKVKRFNQIFKEYVIYL